MGTSIYMVEYTDDYNRKHITFVKDVSSVEFLVSRFENVIYKKTSCLFPEDKLFFGID